MLRVTLPYRPKELVAATRTGAVSVDAACPASVEAAGRSFPERKDSSPPLTPRL